MRISSCTPAGIDILTAIGGLELLVWGGGAEGECLPDDASLQDLAPDLILTGGAEAATTDVCPDATTISLQPTSIEEVLDDLIRVGDACGLGPAAARVMVDLRARYWDARNHVNAFVDGPRVAVLDGLDPLRLAGRWTPGMVLAAGGQPIGPLPGAPSQHIAPEFLLEAAPDRVILTGLTPTTPGIRAALHAVTSSAWWANLPAETRHTAAVLEDGPSFSRPGPALIPAFEWLVEWLQATAPTQASAAPQESPQAPDQRAPDAD